ncbi:MAG: TolC family outer membrane protein [Dongiaceae bacterium]
MTNRLPSRTAWLLIFAGAIVGSAGWAEAQTLDEALAATYASNPTLEAARARLRATDELVPQALSNYRPTASVNGDLGVETEKSTNFGGSGSESATTAPRAARLNVTQPLYRGGRTVAETNQAENLVEAERARLTAVEQDVLLRAVTAYVNVVRDQAVVELTKSNEAVLGRHLKATQDRFSVGEVTRTDVSQAESRLARATAQRIEAEGLLVSSRATYVELVGEMPGTLSEPAIPTRLPATEEETIAESDNNPNIAAAQFAARAAQDGTDLAFGELLPRLSLEGELTTLRDSGFEGQESDSAAITARLTIPLYQAGAVGSRIRESKQRVAQRRREIDEQRRNAVQNATSAWQALETARARIQSFEAEVNAAETALDGVEQEQQVGSRTVLDVLDAQQELFVAQVNLVRSKRDQIEAAYRVLNAIGQLTAQKLSLPVDYYDVMQHYKEVRDKWWGLNASGQ